MPNTTLDVGKRLVALCNAHQNLQAVDELYAPNVVSLELMSMPNMPARMEGFDAVRKKNQWWLSTHTIHESKAMGPFPHGDRFIVHFTLDCTANEGPMKGQRMQMEEAALFTVKDGKIVQEEFFYAMPG